VVVVGVVDPGVVDVGGGGTGVPCGSSRSV
jgi:Ethanolamine utilization protein EutJ (predicted chaperonin)